MIRVHSLGAVIPNLLTGHLVVQVCANSEYYQGYDKFLGLCICQTEDLDSICDTDCRRKQKYFLQIICKDNSPQLISVDSSGNKVFFFLLWQYILF